MSESLNNHSSLGGAVFPPNKPLEPRKQFSKTPVVYDSLFFLDFNKNGNCIVGASEVAGTFWEGTLLYCKNEKHLENFDYAGHYIYSTTSDGKFVNNSIIALAEDTGNINVISVDEDLMLRSVNYFKLIERIPQIAVWNKSSRILSCSGRSVTVWDADSIDRKPIQKYGNFHLERITCVDTLKNDTNLFLSGSTDRNACIWDTRVEVPPSVLYSNEFSSITGIAWNQEDDHYITVGTQAGDIYLLDKRESKDFVSVLHCFDAPVNRVVFNNAKEFAVCGNTKDVLIVKCLSDELHDVYRNSNISGLSKTSSGMMVHYTLAVSESVW
ncbi:hypothetical protein NQ317_006369 [Molorchus minor]|uniref:Uncharacterized protein n=1 Tax=Molorchus minor TaxID=1323400 RepID=A0ABQ9JPX4_9CUCU|nr:hypothetical protein NQ317_006369 [Molorchus minor]